MHCLRWTTSKRVHSLSYTMCLWIFLEFAVDTWIPATFAASGETTNRSSLQTAVLNLNNFSAGVSASWRHYEILTLMRSSVIQQRRSSQRRLAWIRLSSIRLTNWLTLQIAMRQVLTFDLKGGGELTVDSAISKVTLKSFNVRLNIQQWHASCITNEGGYVVWSSFDSTKSHLSFVC